MESLFKPSFPHFYRKRSGGRDVSARATHLKAEIGNVSISTTERKQMSSKTTFKRIALVAVAALGLGVLSVAPSSAVVSTEVLTLSGTTGLTATVNESTTAVTAVVSFFASADNDSRTITASVTGAGSATVVFRSTGNDSANVTVGTNNFKSGSVDTALVVTPNAEVKATYSVLAYGFSAAGAYTITVYTRSMEASVGGVTQYATQKYATFNVTVGAASVAATSIKTFTSTAGSAATAAYYKGTYGATSDSAVPVSAGTAGTYTAAAVIFANLYNAAAETSTGTAKANICATPCTVNAILTGVGLIDNGVYNSKLTPSTFETMVIHNAFGDGASGTQGLGETLTVYSNGTAGTATISYYLAANNVLLGSSTVTFVGGPASVSQLYSNDTITSVAASSGSGTLNAIVKDAASVTLKSGTVYLYSSDTKVAGSTSASAAYQSCTIGSTGVAACAFTVSDTGTATLTIRDSTTVALSTWVSTGWEVTVTGDVAKTLTATFDKASYAPGDRAVLTITANDSAGRGVATGTSLTFSQVVGSSTLNYVTTTGIRGTASTMTDTNFTSYRDTGVETRVITMPSYAGAFTYTIKYSQFTTATTGSPIVEVIASSAVVDPNAAAIAAAKDASDAATDAALEATDAAYAATDAANIAAEAADAATAAAEAATEAANAAKESADAATAAVEELATSVAKLMAALQAQITTLAKVVAKIAVKVKA